MQHGQSLDVLATVSASGNVNLHVVHDTTDVTQRMEEATGPGQGCGLAPHCCHIPAQNSEEAKSSQLKTGLPATVKIEIG